MAQGVQFLTVTDDESGQRLDNYLIARLKGAPKSLIYRVIRKGEVRVNKGRSKPDRKLKEGDVVRVPPVKLGEAKVAPVPGVGLQAHLKASVLYETNELLIVNKPSGLAVHGGSGVNLGLIEALRNMPGANPYLELVHRLDRDTSGCIMVAKKRSMLRYLQQLLREEHQIDKCYLALVKGRWPSRRNVVEAPLQKNELKSGERMVVVSVEGKPSKTEFSIVNRFHGVTLVKAKPITGRTHQIRVHAKYVGHPLIGDEKYGDDEKNKELKATGFRRLFLHAASLEFKLPDGKRVYIEAPLPAELDDPLKRLTLEKDG